MAKKAKLMRAYRLPEKTIHEIERLSDEWECTHAEVIERAISQLESGPPPLEPEAIGRVASNATGLLGPLIERPFKGPIPRPKENKK